MNFQLNDIPQNRNIIERGHAVVNKDLPTPRETEIWVAMNRTTRVIQAEISAALKAVGFPPLKWYDFLWSLERHGGRLRPFELAEDIIFEQSNLSHLSKRLVSENLIEMIDCEGDRRGKIFQITDKGIELRKRMWEIYGPLLHEKMRLFECTGSWHAFIGAGRNNAQELLSDTSENAVSPSAK